jgi:hypothetical protein
MPYYYYCDDQGCPGEHLSKREICSFPDDGVALFSAEHPGSLSPESIEELEIELPDPKPLSNIKVFQHGEATPLQLALSITEEAEDYESVVVVACCKDGTIRIGSCGNSLELAGLMSFAAYHYNERLRDG